MNYLPGESQVYKIIVTYRIQVRQRLERVVEDTSEAHIGDLHSEIDS